MDGFGSASHIHTVSECLRLGYADALHLGWQIVRMSFQ